MTDKRFFECDCGCCVLSVAHDDWDDYTAFVWLTIHGDYHEGWRDRIKQAWNVLRYGHAWNTRELLFRKHSAMQLARWIQAEAEAIRES